MKRIVTFFPGNINVQVDEGTSILDAAHLAGMPISSPCGGQGTCGKCRVLVDGMVESLPSEKIEEEDWKQGTRLACQSYIQADVSVFVPEEMQVDAHKILTSFKEQKLEELSPLTSFEKLVLPAPSLVDNLADWERVERALESKKIQISLWNLRDLPRLLRESGCQINVVVTSKDSGHRLVDMFPGTITPKNLGLAVDIGTTTVVVSLIDLSDGKTLLQASAYNSQLLCGEDIVSRIAFSEDYGVKRLQDLILGTINQMIDRLCEQRYAKRSLKDGICGMDITCMSVAGNTTMIHLFLGLDPKHIRYEPYIPVTNHPPVVKAKDVGIRIHPEAPIYCLPGRAGFVGGDITADILLSGLHHSRQVSLLIDVGTNGEVVLGSRDWMLACSTSAGPAFEGGEVTCGMRAMSGAIDSVKVDDTEIKYTTINESAPRGICGSGLIDLLADLYSNGVVDKKGRLQRVDPRVKERDGEREFVLVASEGKRKGRSRDIAISDNDISNIIRTKAAVYAGCRTLLRSVDMDFSQVDKVFVAGGFGNYLDTLNAITIGLLPDLTLDKFVFLGNAALGGASMCLLSEEMRKEATQVHDALTYLELSTMQAFFDEFSSALFLPHTDLSQFPNVRQERKK